MESLGHLLYISIKENIDCYLLGERDDYVGYPIYDLINGFSEIHHFYLFDENNKRLDIIHSKENVLVILKLDHLHNIGDVLRQYYLCQEDKNILEDISDQLRKNYG